jgi:hypothetical protein
MITLAFKLYNIQQAGEISFYLDNKMKAVRKEGLVQASASSDISTSLFPRCLHSSLVPDTPRL